MQLILNGDTRPIPFFLTSSTDHVTGLTGATVTLTIAKNGGSFAAPAGAVTEMANGWYKLTPLGADTTTNGILVLHGTASGADPVDLKTQVVAFSPYDAAALGLTNLANAVPTTAAIATAAAGDILANPANKLTTNGSGNVTVAGYASAQDPGTLVWNAAVASFDTAGTFGYVVQNGGSGGPTLNQIVAGVWDAATATYNTAGSLGLALGSVPSAAAIAAAVAAPSSGAIATAVWAAPLTEGYSVLGTAGSYTASAVLYDIRQRNYNFKIQGAAINVLKLDGVTTAHTLTLDSATAPTQSIETA